MITTGKKARQRHGNRFACKRAKAKKESNKSFGSLPYSFREGKGNAASFRAVRVAKCDCATGCDGISGGQHSGRGTRLVA